MYADYTSITKEASKDTQFGVTDQDCVSGDGACAMGATHRLHNPNTLRPLNLVATEVKLEQRRQGKDARCKVRLTHTHVDQGSYV